MSKTLPIIAVAGCLTAGHLPAVAYPQPTAVSAESRAIGESLAEVRALHERSLALSGAKSGLISTIWSLFQEHGEPGWDGADAEALDESAAEQAIALIRALPDHVPLPEAGVDPDGAITLDWIQSRHCSLTISVDASGSIPYAWIQDGDRGHGVFRFDGITCPRMLLRLIIDVAGGGNDALGVA